MQNEWFFIHKYQLNGNKSVIFHVWYLSFVSPVANQADWLLNWSDISRVVDSSPRFVDESTLFLSIVFHNPILISSIYHTKMHAKIGTFTNVCLLTVAIDKVFNHLGYWMWRDREQNLAKKVAFANARHLWSSKLSQFVLTTWFLTISV